MSICRDIEETNNCKILVHELSKARRDRNIVVIVVGEMSIEYIGRASSHAYPAHRLLILKPDGTLLIHESIHVEPLNWQPPRSISYFECIGDRLRIRSIRDNPHEEVIVEFTSIEFIKLCKLASTRLGIVGKEVDIVKSILLNPSVIEEGATVIGSDIATAYGKIDVLLRKDGKLIVVEVKNERAGISAVTQLKRYVEYYVGQGYKVEGVLVAPQISREALMILSREGFRYINSSKLLIKTRSSSTLEKFIKIDKIS